MIKNIGIFVLFLVMLLITLLVYGLARLCGGMAKLFSALEDILTDLVIDYGIG